MAKKYNTKEAVELMKSWGISFTPGTLAVWRSHKEGPKYIKIRNRVYYTEQSLHDFVRGLEIQTIG